MSWKIEDDHEDYRDQSGDIAPINNKAMDDESQKFAISPDWEEEFDKEFNSVVGVRHFHPEIEDEIKLFIESEIIAKMYQDIEDALLMADTLTMQDLKRGMLALENPELLAVYEQDKQETLNKVLSLRSKWLSK